jgi:hypothetical protein
MLQAHNPNYLKATSSRNGGSDDGSKDAYDNIDEIPIAELKKSKKSKKKSKKEQT